MQISRCLGMNLLHKIRSWKYTKHWLSPLVHRDSGSIRWKFPQSIATTHSKKDIWTRKRGWWLGMRDNAKRDGLNEGEVVIRFVKTQGRKCTCKNFQITSMIELIFHDWWRSQWLDIFFSRHFLKSKKKKIYEPTIVFPI